MYKMLRHEEAKIVETWPGVFRRVLSLGERILLLELNIKRGAKTQAHSHPNEQAGYVVKGRLKLRIGEKIYELLPGDAYIIPPNVEHEGEALEEVVVIEIFSPPHELLRKDLEEV